MHSLLTQLTVWPGEIGIPTPALKSPTDRNAADLQDSRLQPVFRGQPTQPAEASKPDHRL
jgi:hypothetical protein